MSNEYGDLNMMVMQWKLLQGSYALKPRPHFCRTISSVYKKDIFLPKEFITPKLEDNFMLLVVAESYKK